jgi:predicted patatin/cPLA2 family phospholipase
MIVVHDIFVCKPGNAGKLAKMCKEHMGTFPETVNILTDMTGQYHRVIMVSQFENLAEYENNFKKWQHPTPEMKKMNEAFAGMNDMYTSGSREIFKVW